MKEIADVLWGGGICAKIMEIDRCFVVRFHVISEITNENLNAEIRKKKIFTFEIEPQF